MRDEPQDAAQKPRFGRHWAKWDAARAAGRQPHEFLGEISDESLAELLASAGVERRYEKDVIAVELQNRLRRRKARVADAVEETMELHATLDEVVQSTHEAVADTARHVDALVKGEAEPSDAMAKRAEDALEGIAATREGVDELRKTARHLAQLRDEQAARSRKQDA